MRTEWIIISFPFRITLAEGCVGVVQGKSRWTQSFQCVWFHFFFICYLGSWCAPTSHTSVAISTLTNQRIFFFHWRFFLCKIWNPMTGGVGQTRGCHVFHVQPEGNGLGAESGTLSGDQPKASGCSGGHALKKYHPQGTARDCSVILASLSLPSEMMNRSIRIRKEEAS